MVLDQFDSLDQTCNDEKTNEDAINYENLPPFIYQSDEHYLNVFDEEAAKLTYFYLFIDWGR